MVVDRKDLRRELADETVAEVGQDVDLNKARSFAFTETIQPEPV